MLAAVRDAALGDVVELSGELADDTDRVQAGADRLAVERVHDPRFVAFLEGAWAAWTAEDRSWDALPIVWPTHVFARGDEPASIDGRLSYWSFDAGTPITAGTWDAALASARVALAAQHAVADGAAGAAFALCRPPGHHAAADAYGGYCYLNNSAIAAQSFVDGGAGRVAVIDVDYHHGNGTQSIFWERPDVLTVSLHADPSQEYPYFLGRADETGGGAGAGANLNFPMPWGTGFDRWSAALDDACRAVASVRTRRCRGAARRRHPRSRSHLAVRTALRRLPCASVPGWRRSGGRRCSCSRAATPPTSSAPTSPTCSLDSLPNHRFGSELCGAPADTAKPDRPPR